MVRGTAATRAFFSAWEYRIITATGLVDKNDQLAMNHLMNFDKTWESLDVGVWEDELDGNYFPNFRCAAYLDVKKSDAKRFTKEGRSGPTRCAAVHSIFAGKGDASVKLQVIKDMWQKFTGKNSTTDQDGCVRASYGKVAIGYGDPGFLL